MCKNPHLPWSPPTYLFWFLGQPTIPTNVNDVFIQPYTPNKTLLRWNRFKKWISFLQVSWFLVDWRPPSGPFRPEAQHFGIPANWHFWKRRAPTNDEDPFNKFLKLLDMGSISIKKYEMGIWWYVTNIFWKHPRTLFYFQVRESPAPLRIPTPKPFNITRHLDSSGPQGFSPSA